jgi:tetratricopeptide (TPR) repeat protein
MKSLCLVVMVAAGLLACQLQVVNAGVPEEARIGAELFKDSSYGEAAEAFRQATITEPSDVRWRYNLGVSEAKNGDLDNALSNLDASSRVPDQRISADAHYNAGNVFYAKQDFVNAAKSYRQSLLRRPDDADAKRNLELALEQLRRMQQQAGDSSQQQKDPSQQGKSDQKGDQQGSDSTQQQQQQQLGQQDSLQNQSGDSLQNTPDLPDSVISREQAERILKALADDEAKLRDQARRMRVLPAPGGKDW